jgi:hypothetical protein
MVDCSASKSKFQEKHYLYFRTILKCEGIFRRLPEDPSLPCTSAMELGTVLCFGSFSSPVQTKRP